MQTSLEGVLAAKAILQAVRRQGLRALPVDTDVLADMRYDLIESHRAELAGRHDAQEVGK